MKGYSGVSPVANAMEKLNDISLDAKSGIKKAEHQLELWASQLADPNGVLEIHGRRYSGAERFGTAATLDLNRGTEEMQNMVSAFLSLLNSMIQMDKTLSSVSGS